MYNSTVSQVVLFTWIDYAFFTIMLSVSACIGVYYGCFGTKQSTTKEYYFGGKSMRSFPVAMSLVASHLSGITLLGIPAEVYFHGTQIWMFCLSSLFVMVAILYVYLPVFFKLQLVSAYEYLKLRFDHKVRKLASLLYVIATLLYVPIVIYIPALAFNQVTGIRLSIICPIICIVCIFYTTIGGLKAVVVSDALQFSVTLGTMVTVMIIGVYSAGGFGAIWEKAENSQRIEFFNMKLDPTERSTFWGVVVGFTATWVGNLALNPSSIQRFLSMPSFNVATRAVVIFTIGTIVTKSLSVFSGLLMYAKYHDCDPLSIGAIKKRDQLLPYYVLDITSHLPGLPGLFTAGVFCTALSTMSTSLNTLAGTIYEDFLKSRLSKAQRERPSSEIMKVIVVVVGLLSLGMVFLVEKLGGIVEVSLSFHGITTGPLLGLFTLGMLCPSANEVGALYGGIASTLFISFLVCGTQLSNVNGIIKHANKPTSIDGCLIDSNTVTLFDNSTFLTTLSTLEHSSLSPTSSETEHQPFGLFLISFYYYTFMGALIVLLIGLPLSWMTNKGKPKVDPDLLSPCIYWLYSLKKSDRQELNQYDTVDGALKIMYPSDIHNEKILDDSKNIY